MLLKQPFGRSKTMVYSVLIPVSIPSIATICCDHFINSKKDKLFLPKIHLSSARQASARLAPSLVAAEGYQMQVQKQGIQITITSYSYGAELRGHYYYR